MLSSCKIKQYTSAYNVEGNYFIDINTLRSVCHKTAHIEVILIKTPPKVDKNILRLLECPVCKEIMTSSIYQCKTGHSFCDVCTKKLKSCSICQHELTGTLNYGLMELCTQMVGCNSESAQAQQEPCLPYECPLKASKNCRFSGNDKYELIEHCTNVHEYLLGDSYDFRWTLEEQNIIITKIICAYGNVFKSCRIFTGSELLWNIQVYGGKEEANKYSFTIEFVHEMKKIVFSDVCECVTGEIKLFEKGLRIPHNQLAEFVSDKVCKTNVFIKKITTPTIARCTTTINETNQ